MQNYFKNIAALFMLCVLFLINQSCKKGNDPETPAVTTPVITTENASEITQTTAFSGGHITSDGGAVISARGVCWGTTHNPTTASNKTDDGTDIGTFSSYLYGLTANTTYYVRAYAINSKGTGYGNEISFSTIPLSTATVIQPYVTSVTLTSAVAVAYISSTGGGNITVSGFCWKTSQNPTTADIISTDGGLETGNYSSRMTGLTANTTYYVRPYVTNSMGTSYGDQVSFTTGSVFSQIIFNPDLIYGTISDIEGNIYKTIGIGTQTWMAENLITGTLNDGTAIPYVAESQEWTALTTPGYCWYNNETDYTKGYGALYNWYAVNSGKLCPTGWHVATDNEWTVFVDYLGGMETASAKIRETGLSHWQGTTTDATNISGFSALPSGCRFWDGQFNAFGISVYLWSSTEYNQSGGMSLQWFYWSDDMGTFSSTGRGNNSSNDGLSVRCLKD
jgi:uncharacterized protein (TIGR02145 family)